jgi:ATP-dependent helicase YprA (DUF1998 family)
MSAPAAHVAQLCGLEESALRVVSEDGSPSGAKTFVLWNPPARADTEARLFFAFSFYAP